MFKAQSKTNKISEYDKANKFQQKKKKVLLNYLKYLLFWMFDEKLSKFQYRRSRVKKAKKIKNKNDVILKN